MTFLQMSRSRPLQVAAGLACSALGLAVVIAWLRGFDPLIRVHPLFPPMPYSVAMGLLGCGVTLLAVAGGRRRLACGAAAAVVLLGLMTLVRHAFGLAWNMDQTILSGVTTGIHEGMAPSSALSFVLLGVGLFAVSLNQHRGDFACALCGTTIATQSGVVFLASTFGTVGAYSIAGSDVAPHVAVGLTVAGIGTIAAAWRPDQQRSEAPRWLPLPVALGMALISVSLWQQSASDRRAALEGATLLRAERIGAEINRRASLLVAALLRLADAPTRRPAGDSAVIEPRAVAALDLERFPSVYGIAFFNQRLQPVWAETRDGAELPPPVSSALEKSIQPGSPTSEIPGATVVDDVELGPGRSGFLLRVPVFSGSHSDGFVVGVFRYTDFFHAVIGQDIGADYWLRVVAGQRELYRIGEAAAADNSPTGAAAIPFLGSTWHAQIWPRSGVSVGGTVANRTLVFGLLFSVLLGWTVQLGQRSAQRATQLRTAIAAHAENEVRFKQIIDAAADIIYRTDHRGRFVFVNPAAVHVLGWSRDELIGRDFLSLIRHDHQAAVGEFYQKQATERIASTYFDFPAVTADGREVWIGQHAQLLTEGDRIVGFQAVARDISGRIQTLRELEQTRDAALQTARLKSEFLAHTSHEIRTPLNGILGFSNLLLGTSLTAEQRTYTDGLRVSADSLLAIVNDVLDYSKIEAGMLRLEAVPFDLRAPTDNAIVVLADAARRKRIGLAVEVEDGIQARVIGDPSRLRQVLTNLIANAIKFTDTGGVTIRMATSSQTETHVVIAFSVQDTGIGIDADTQDRLFQPFVQADGTSSRFGGTGLGLAICRQLVELMGGSIDVESAPGGGTTFSFTARFEKQLQAEPASAVPTFDITHLRLLVVSDTPSFREEIGEYAAAWGTAVVFSQTGEGGVGALREAVTQGRPYDVAILSLVHPQDDGLAVARRIKADPSLTSVKLVFVPLMGMPGDARAAADAGVAAYLPRPVRGPELLRCLKSIMQVRAERDRGGAGTRTSLVTRHTLDEQRTGPLGRILVTDDTPVSAQVTKLQIEKLGYEVDTATNGVEAVEAASRVPYDLILMDCQMPVMDGFQATAEIRRRERAGCRTPIVAFTASSASASRERCLRADMDDFLEKPIRSNELIDVLHRWVPSASSPAVAQSVERPADAIEIVDARVFDALQASLGTPALVKAIELHLEQAVTSILAIERAANDNRVEDVATEAHRLRGGAYTLGFQRMGALCAALEDDASRHTKTERLELVGRLHRACWELREFVSAWNLTGTAS